MDQQQQQGQFSMAFGQSVAPEQHQQPQFQSQVDLNAMIKCDYCDRFIKRGDIMQHMTTQHNINTPNTMYGPEATQFTPFESPLTGINAQFNMYNQFANPIVTAAGQKFFDSSNSWIDRNVRPFFAVDDSYVMKKLAILLFPFIHRQWLFVPEDQPKYNVNSPDLYIPLMAFVTYVLGAGYMLGLKGKFSPEQLGMVSSSALVCLSIEVCLLMLIFHFCNVRCWFNFIHYLAYCSYKFVPIILSMLVSLLFTITGYYLTIAYTTIALGYYMIRSFHVAIEAGSFVHDNLQPASRLGDYIIGGFSLAQPLFIIWLSYHLVP